MTRQDAYRPRARLTDVSKASALHHVRRWGYHVAEMAAAAGISVNSMRAALREDEEFADAVTKAHGAYVGVLRRAAYERAVTGFKGRNGEQVYSDRLLLKLLEGQDRETFGTKVQVEQQTTHRVELPDTRIWPREAKIKLEEAFALAEAAGAAVVPALPAATEAQDAQEAEWTEAEEGLERDHDDLPEE